MHDMAGTAPRVLSVNVGAVRASVLRAPHVAEGRRIVERR